MKTLVLLTAVVALAVAIPLDVESANNLKDFLASNEVSADQKQNLASYNYAVDLSAPATQSIFACLRQSGYATAFLRVYKPDGRGSVDQDGIASVKYAYSANMGVEVYHTPAVQSNKPGYQQFDESYTALRNAGINVRTIWLQVTSPVNWGSNQQYNIELISAFLNRGKTYNVNVGVYTNWYDWSQITGSWSGWTSAELVSLWYWNANGIGSSAKSSEDFSDFRAFGGWTQPAVKQFSLQANLCGVQFNRNIYPAGTYALSRSSAVADNEILVGNLIV